MAGAQEPGYGTNALQRHARVLLARVDSSGNLAIGPVGRPSRIGSRAERRFAERDPEGVAFEYPVLARGYRCTRRAPLTMPVVIVRVVRVDCANPTAGFWGCCDQTDLAAKSGKAGARRHRRAEGFREQARAPQLSSVGPSFRRSRELPTRSRSRTRRSGESSWRQCPWQKRPSAFFVDAGSSVRSVSEFVVYAKAQRVELETSKRMRHRPANEILIHVNFGNRPRSRVHSMPINESCSAPLCIPVCIEHHPDPVPL
jgi:hypothetical protein